MKIAAAAGILVIALVAVIEPLKAQTDPVIARSAQNIEMLFPGGKSKALILSFDDGPTADRRLVKLINDYGLVGTFHLNSNKLGTKDYLSKEELRELFKGHEVSVHSANHPSLSSLSKIDIIYEIVEDRRELERLTGNPVRGMAYPFGDYNDFVVETIRGLGIEYARTVGDTYDFKIPEDFLKWHPTIHQFGKAYYEPDNPEHDRKETERFFGIIDKFLKTDSLALLDIWGHSWENNGAGDRWKETERYFKMLSGNPDICYTTQIGLVDYINAFRNLKFSVNKDKVTNLSSIDVHVRIDKRVYKVSAGTTSKLTD